MSNKTKDLLVLLGIGAAGYGVYYYIKHRSTTAKTSGATQAASTATSGLDPQTKALLDKMIAQGKVAEATVAKAQAAQNMIAASPHQSNWWQTLGT